MRTSTGRFRPGVEALEAREVPAGIAADDTFTTHMGATIDSLAPGVLANDSGSGKSVTSWTQPLDAVTGADISRDSLYMNSYGRMQYKPAPGFVGDVTFQYAAKNSAGATGTGTITVHVTDALPVAAAVTLDYSTPVNTTLRVAAPGLVAPGVGSDPDGDKLQPAGWSADLTAAPNGDGYYTPGGGHVWIGYDGSFVYKPKVQSAGDEPNADSFRYALWDGQVDASGAKVTSGPIIVNINGGLPIVPVVQINHQPTVDNFNAGEVLHGQTLSIDLLAHARDEDKDALTIEIVDAPPAAKGTLGKNATTGKWDFTASATFVGTVEFTYRAYDGKEYSASGKVTITVTNRPPSAPVDLDGVDGGNVDEGVAAGTLVGITVHADDPDGDDGDLVLVGENSTRFRLNGFYEVEVATSVDYETSTLVNGQRGYWLTVRAFDEFLDSTDSTFFVRVNNLPPANLRDANASVNKVEGFADAGTGVGISVRADDPGDPQNQSCVRYSLDPNGNPGNMFQINAISGMVTVRDGEFMNFAMSPYYVIKVVASDGSGGSTSEAPHEWWTAGKRCRL